MSNRILSYKGLMVDGSQETILLSTRKGEVGYRIIKLQLMCQTPGAGNQESVVQLFKDEQDTIDGNIDFSDNRLLGAAVFTASTNQKTDPEDFSVMFDHEIFNQDIYITHNDNEGSLAINYYLELEAIKLTEDQAMVATLKDIRNNSTD
jgi:hypothetical protein